MKTLLKTICVFTLMLSTVSSYGIKGVSMSPLNDVKKLNYISVFDASGEIIYSARINYTGDLTRLFDFTQLKNGMYTAEINKDFEIEIITIKVKDNIVSVLNADPNVIYKPLVRSKNARLMISKLALNSKQMIVELYFEGNLIHVETLKGEKTLNRVYKLDQTITGNYKVIIKSDDRVFSENFKI